MTDKIFTNGLIFKAPHEKSPQFVKGSLSIKVDEFTKFIQEHSNNGWINIDLKVSTSGKWYAELNTYKSQTKEVKEEVEEEEINTEDIPF